MALAVLWRTPKDRVTVRVDGIKDEEAAVKTLLDHGFSGQSVVLGKGTIILLDTDSSMRDNVDKASKVLGQSSSHKAGDVEFISKENYGKAKSDYKDSTKGLEQVPERSKSFCFADVQTAEEISEADDGDGHWVTIDGSHVFISSNTGTITKGPTHLLGKQGPNEDRLVAGSTLPPKDKPVVVVFGGSFNPPHEGNVATANKAVELLRKEGYNVDNLVSRSHGRQTHQG